MSLRILSYFSHSPLYLSILFLFCAGCTSLSTKQSVVNEDYQECRRFFSKLDLSVQQSGVLDASAVRIKNYPWLRLNRFLASYRNKNLNNDEFLAWVDRLQQLDLSARKIENQNLPTATLESLGFNNSAALNAAAENCSIVMRNHDLQDSKSIRTALKIPTEYQYWKHVVGIYPLTSIGILVGTNNLKKEVKASFAKNAREELNHEKINVYSPPENPQQLVKQHQIAEILKTSAQNPLGIPEPNAEQREKLFSTFAPIWAVETITNDDRIGQPGWRNDKSVVNTESAAAYRLLSHTRYADKVLLQLNYTVWFPARTVTGKFDFLGGHLDGITWRVTLDEDGTPLLYNSMHNCGCYHKFYPTNRLQQKPKKNYEEALLVPTVAPTLKDKERMVLKVANLTHYIEAIDVYEDKQITSTLSSDYIFEDYKKLQTLQLPNGGSRSLFGPDGIVAGTQRLERWILWPMGVPEPGAMRQWGHHATAFVGQRHFDDPNLIERYFEMKDTE